MGFLGLCLLVAGADAAVTETSVRTWYLTLHRPPLVPPNWLFGPVWTVLYLMMGTAAWLVWRRVGAGPALRLWGWQLLLNALWTPAFFGLHLPRLALAVMVALFATILLTIRAFAPIQRLAAWLLVPYAAWVAFAAYLNAGFVWLN